MSKYVKELCQRIGSNHEDWRPIHQHGCYYGLTNGIVRVTWCGLGYVSSIAELHVLEHQLPLHRWDRFRLEVALKCWYVRASMADVSEVVKETNKEHEQ